MSKILVTGSLGLVGSAASKLFIEKGWGVIGIDNNMRATLLGAKKSMNYAENIDIRDADAIEGLFKRHKFDAIIHAAAQPSHDWAQKSPLTDFDINARATLLLLEATRLFSPKATFIHVSTDKVYGENMRTSLEEEDTRYVPHVRATWKGGYTEELGLDFAGNRSLFGCSKTAADIYAQEYANYFGMNVAVFRPGCITGKSHAGVEYHGFLAYMARCAREKIPYRIFGFKGKQVRDQIHANDLAAAFYQVVAHGVKKHDKELFDTDAVYNIGGGPERSISVLEALNEFEKRSGFHMKTEYINEPRKGDRIWDVHDVSKFRSHYPEWEYSYDLTDILDDVFEQ